MRWAKYDSKIVDFQEAMQPSELEITYDALYGEEFVSDLKDAYRWMRMEMRRQPPLQTVAQARWNDPDDVAHQFFFVDFYKEELLIQTISRHGATVQSLGHSGILNARKETNLQFLLTGLYAYDNEKGCRWAKKLLTENRKIRIPKISKK